MRLFTAAFISKDVAENIYQYSQPTAVHFNTNAVSPENMHITLKYFGDKNPENCLKILENSVKNIEKFSVVAKGMDFFSYGKYAGVLWAGIKDESFSLNKIALNIDNSQKDYIPHVTLARFKNDSVENAVISKHLRDVFLKAKEFGAFTVETVALIESILGSDGVNYRIVKEFNLR